MRIADLDDLEERVLDNGDCQACGDVANRGAFLLRLLNAAVHEYGAARAQVNRVLGTNGRLGERGNVQVQAACEALDERTATRGACLVQHDVIDDAVLDAQALHVLTADVEDELDAGEHLLSATQVRNGFDLAGVNAQRLEQQALTVTGNRRMTQGHERLARLVNRQLLIQLRHGTLGATENIALVGSVG